SCLIAFYKNRGRLLSWYTDLLSHSETLTIVIHRVGAPRTVVTGNPLNVEYILSTNFANFPKGKPFTDLLGDFLGTGIFNVDGEMWSAQRKLASHEFSTKSLREFTAGVLGDEIENRLVPVLEGAAVSGGVLDVQEVLRRFSFNVICRLVLGTEPFFQDLSSGIPPSGIAAAFDAASAISAMRGAMPVMGVWKMKRLLNAGSERELKRAVKTVHNCVEEMIGKSRKGNGGDLLSRFLKGGVADDDDTLLRDMVISFLMAGRETTSAAMTWLFYLLSANRTFEKRVVAEASGGDRLSPFDRARETNFLKACICEALRLYPPVAWDSKHARNDDVLPDGTRVRSGDRVTYFPYGMGRMERLWGDDPLKFDPDRWLDEIGGFKRVSPYKFPVFQAGPRVCLGKEMAFIQMNYVVASVLTRFEFHPVRTDPPVFVPLLTAHMAGGFNVRVSRR
ncbi:hypothetical protein M569_08223, partial [Genlisea aurea]